jgi:hypothetical protein
MLMKSAERWHCTNPSCRAEIVVGFRGSLEGSNPRCACGAVFKKEYSAPVFRYLDFLQLEQPRPSEAARCPPGVAGPALPETAPPGE